jgi:hypothetical protein
MFLADKLPREGIAAAKGKRVGNATAGLNIDYLLDIIIIIGPTQ